MVYRDCLNAQLNLVINLSTDGMQPSTGATSTMPTRGARLTMAYMALSTFWRTTRLKDRLG